MDRHPNRPELAPLAAAIDQITGGLEKMLAGFAGLKTALLGGGVGEQDSDPADPGNKHVIGGLEKLTDRGVEICYRLFDAGKTRYAVAKLMNISFGAAHHRQKAWEKAGGVNRTRRPLA